MKRLFKKLNQSAGNTLMMALLFMLVAVTVSVIVLTGAAAAARRVESDKNRQQSYLSLSSAAQLMRDSILADSFTQTVTSYERRDESLPEKEDSVVTQKASKEFDRLLNEAVEHINSFAAPYTNDLMAIKMNGLPSVNLKFNMDVDYSIEIQLWIDDSQGYEGSMTLFIEGVSLDTVSYGSIRNEYDFVKTETAISWQNARIGKGSFE